MRQVCLIAGFLLLMLCVVGTSAQSRHCSVVEQTKSVLGSRSNGHASAPPDEIVVEKETAEERHFMDMQVDMIPEMAGADDDDEQDVDYAFCFPAFDLAREQANIFAKKVRVGFGHASRFVTRVTWNLQVWTVSWKATHFYSLPEWLQDNDFLHSGHRPPLPSFTACFRSIFRVHTETGNIWTHMIGASRGGIGASAGECNLRRLRGVHRARRLLPGQRPRPSAVRRQVRLPALLPRRRGLPGLVVRVPHHALSLREGGQDFQQVSPFSSAVPPMWRADSRSIPRLDYVGIALLIMGSFVPWVYYGFYCHFEPKVAYITTVCVLGLGCIVVSLWNRFGEPRFRPLRAGSLYDERI